MQSDILAILFYFSKMTNFDCIYVTLNMLLLNDLLILITCS